MGINLTFWEYRSVRYGVAVVATLASALLRWLMPEALAGAPYLAFYPAVVVAAVLGGVVPGLVATVGSLLVVNFVFGNPGYIGIDLLTRYFMWTVGGTAVSLLAGRMHTARQQAESEAEALRKSKEATRQSLERLEKVLDVETVGIMFWDLTTGCMVDANNTFLRTMGYSRQEIEARELNWQTLTPPEYIDVSRREVEKFLATGRVGPYEKEYFRKDGTRQWLLFAGSSLGGNQCVEFCVDISDRKKAEAALRESEERLMRAQEIAHLGSWELDLATDRLTWSDEVYRIFGMKPREFAATYEAFLERVHPDDRRKVDEAYGVSLRENRDVYEIEHRVVRKDTDDVRTVHEKCEHFRDGSGKIIRSIGMVHDITERKQAEEALRESEAQFRNLANAIPQLCWMADADGWIFWYNDRWYEYTGTTPEQMEGWGWQSVHDADALPSVLERWKGSIASGQHFDMVFPLRGADGVFRPFLTRVLPIKDAQGKVVHWFGTNTDVTELRDAEDALRASEQRWATTLQSIGDAVISTDATGRIVFMNEVAQRLTGWSFAEAKGKDLTAIFNIVQEVTRIRPENPVAKVLRLGEVVGLANHTALIRRDGMEIPIDDSGAPIRNREGQIEGVVLVFHDVSEQRRMEKVLRETDRLATTGRLAASIAHEIHNPLDVIGNLLHLITHSTQEEETREEARLASDELERLAQMTRQMLTFQRESSKPVPVQIKDVIENVLALYRRKLDSACIDVQSEIDSPEPLAAHPGELRQVFANLIGNAIEAVGRSQGKIRIRAYQAHNWRNGHSGLRVVVADNGKGIPNEAREKVFEPFFTTKGESGTGLGLWVTTGIVSKYNGALRVRSTTRAGRSGTCFSVFFPMASKGAAADD